MKTLYTMSDISTFISQNHYGLWTNNIFDKKLNKTRQANKDDFTDESKITTFELLDVYDDKTFKDFSISNFTFSALKYDSTKGCKVVEKDLSDKWTSFLLEEHKEYADEFVAWCNKNIQAVDKTLQSQSETKASAKTGKLQKLRSSLTKFLKKGKSKIKDRNKSDDLTIS